MKLRAKVIKINGSYAFDFSENISDSNILLSTLENCEVVVDVKKAEGTRTIQQNSALHLYFSLLAESLNEAGYDMKKVIKKEFDIPWTLENIKNHLWRPIQNAYFNKKSTKQLNKNEIDKVYEVLNKVIGERTGVYVEFPNINSLQLKYARTTRK